MIEAMVWTLTAPMAWIGRSAYTITEIVLVYGADSMAEEMQEAIDTIMNINAAYVPKLMIEALVIIAFLTFVIGLYELSEKSKENARTHGEKIAYGFNYLTQNITVIIVGMVLTLFLTGWLISTGIIDGSTLYDCAGTVFVVAVIMGLGGDKLFRKVIEIVRNNRKADEAVAEAKTETATAKK